MKQLSGKRLALLFLLSFAASFMIFQVASPAWVTLNSLKTSDVQNLANYLELFGSPFYHQAICHSLKIAGWPSLLGLFIVVLGSHPLRRADSRLYGFIMVFSNMISSSAGVPLTFAFIILLGLNGALTLSLKQADWIDDFNLYSKIDPITPYTYFQIFPGVMLLYPAFDALCRDWRKSAALLGANSRQYWRHIGIPVLTPTLLGTFVVLLTNALGAYTMMYSLTTGNFNVISICIGALVVGDVFPDPNMASALAMALAGLMTLITLVHRWLLRRSYHVAH